MRMNNTVERTAGRSGMIDSTKGIGIILVIAAHLFQGVDALSLFKVTAFSFHIPLFFVVSGILYNREKYRNFGTFIKSRARTMICPYVFFGVFSTVVTIVMNVILNRGADAAALRKFLGWFLQLLYARDAESMSVNLVLWFVPCLLMTEIIFFFVLKIKSRPVYIASVVLISVAGYIMTLPVPNRICRFLPWNLPSAMFAVGFFALGNSLRKTVLERIPEKIKAPAAAGCIGAAAILIAICVLTVTKTGQMGLGNRNLGNGICFYLTGIAGSAAVLTVAAVLKNSKVLGWTGRNSMYLMMLHLLFASVIKKIFRFLHLGVPDTTRLPVAVLNFAAVIVCCVIFILIYKKVKDMIMMKTEQSE